MKLAYVPPTGPIRNPGLSTNLQALNGSEFVSRFFPMLVTIFFVIGAIIFVFVFLLGAIQWINAGGDKGKLESAKDKITQAIIGIFVLLSVFAIINLVEIFFDTDLTYFDINNIKL